MVPETVGVALIALGCVLLLILPFLDRSTPRGRTGRGLTVLFAAGVAYAVVFQTLASIAPGVERPKETPAAETYGLAASLVSLALLWLVIGFLVFYLRQLLKENARARRLYASGTEAR